MGDFGGDVELSEFPSGQRLQQPVYGQQQQLQQLPAGYQGQQIMMVPQGVQAQVILRGAENYNEIPNGRPWIKGIIGVSAVDAAVFVAILILWAVAFSTSHTVVLLSLLEILVILKVVLGLAAIPYIYLDIWEQREGGKDKQEEVQHTSRGLIIFYLIICGIAILLSLSDFVTRIFLLEDCGATSTLPCYTGFEYNVEITFIVLAVFEFLTSVFGVVCGGVVYMKLTYFKTIWMQGRGVMVEPGQIGSNSQYAVQTGMPSFSSYLGAAPMNNVRSYKVTPQQAYRAPAISNWTLSSAQMMMGQLHSEKAKGC